MNCAVVGEKYVWFFLAPDPDSGEKIAATILDLEELGGNHIECFSPERKSYWKATGIPLEESAKMRIKIGRVIEVTAKEPPFDALYCTRLQRERITPETRNPIPT